MEWVKINGKSYDVLVTELTESFNVLYSENTGRTLSERARMILDPIGTFYGHKVTFQRKTGKEDDYDELFSFLSQPRYDGVPVEIVHNQSVINYEAYVSQGERSLKKIDTKSNKVYWDKMTINIIPMEAYITP